MAIKSIRVKNFKSFKDVEVQLENFNVLIGANASGKSNFIHIVEFLRDAQRYGLENAISLQGGPEYLVNFSVGRSRALSVDIVMPSEFKGGRGIGISKDRRFSLFQEEGESHYSFEVGFPVGKPGFEILRETLSVKGEFFTANESQPVPRQLHRLGIGEIVLVRKGDRVNPTKITPPEGVNLQEYALTSWLAEQSAPSTSLFLQSYSFSLSNLANHVAIYDLDSRLPKKATPITGKAELEEDGSNLASVLKNIIDDGPAKRNLTNLLQDLLPFVVDLEVERFADKSLAFSLKENFAEGRHVPAPFLSDGTINITGLIVALYFENKPIAIFEEPERNLHPHLISRIVAMMKEASRHKQVIVTTQNPEVVKNTDIADVLLVSRDKEGFSTVTRPAEREDVKVFLQNELGLEDLFAQNLLHA